MIFFSSSKGSISGWAESVQRSSNIYMPFRLKIEIEANLPRLSMLLKLTKQLIIPGKQICMGQQFQLQVIQHLPLRIRSYFCSTVHKFVA